MARDASTSRLPSSASAKPSKSRSKSSLRRWRTRRAAISHPNQRLGDAIIRDDESPALGFGQVIENDDRHFGHAEASYREQPSMLATTTSSAPIRTGTVRLPLQNASARYERTGSAGRPVGFEGEFTCHLVRRLVIGRNARPLGKWAKLRRSVQGMQLCNAITPIAMLDRACSRDFPSIGCTTHVKQRPVVITGTDRAGRQVRKCPEAARNQRVTSWTKFCKRPLPGRSRSLLANQVRRCSNFRNS